MYQGLDFEQFAKEVHQNAVDHGWWEEDRPVYEVMALIHSEWSEALEEYRAGRPMVWHKCAYNGGMCETQDVHNNEGGCIGCTIAMCKPEGIAVELLDGCIRILDFMAHRGIEWYDCYFEDGFSPNSNTAQPVPELVNDLHDEISHPDYDYEETLATAVGMVFDFTKKNGLDPVALMLEKHEYNKTRTYKHGGKVC